MLKLEELLKYDDIVIQCHDNPDADTMASGFGLYEYFKFHNKDVRLIYSGKFEVAKPNLKMMIDILHIPIEYVQKLHKPNLLVTVDAQLKEGNIKFFEAETYCTIDHHISCGAKTQYIDIRPYLGSCSTVVWDLLLQAKFEINHNVNLATALYYGLFTDTNNFAEMRHPLDRDMIEDVQYDKSIIRRLKGSNLSKYDLETAGIALIKCSMNEKQQFAVFEARPCDPNILGFISDLAIQVENILTCIVYFQGEDGIKFSVRSCTNEVKANEFAEYVSKDVGTGGGHIDKAGGFINERAFKEKYRQISPDNYFHNITKEYFEQFDIIYAKDKVVDVTAMKSYRKKEVVIGYVPSIELFEEGIPIRIRTLEGDIDFVASPDIYILVGVEGKAKPIQREKFERSYLQVEDQRLDISFEYTPRAKNKDTEEEVALTECIRACMASNAVEVFARVLKKNIKVFTLWENEQYISGFKGDYLVVREDDLNDISIIRKDLFEKTYIEV